MSPSVQIRFEGGGAPEVLKAAKKEVKVRLKKLMADEAKRIVLPRVRELAPTFVEDHIVVKGAVKGPKITTAGSRKWDRIIGLLNYGGDVRDPIAPKDKEGHQFLSIGGEFYRSRVTKPRHYEGKDFIERGIAESFDEFESRVLDGVMGAFNGMG